MNKDLNYLPDWDDNMDEGNEEGEEWKPNVTRTACKALYQQWGTVMTMLMGGLHIEAETEKSHSSFHKSKMMGDAYEVAAKIMSSQGAGMYVVRMENACNIRKNAQSIQSSMLVCIMEGEIDEEYGLLIRSEIEVFKKLFKAW